MAQFLAALQTFCVPLNPDEQAALMAEAKGHMAEGWEQPELFIGNQRLFQVVRELAVQKGYIENRFAEDSLEFHKPSLPRNKIPLQARKTLGLVAEEVERLKHSVEQMLLTSSPAKVIDRAARGVDWQVQGGDFPYFQDSDGLRVDYRDEGLALDKLKESVLAMDPRTADGWRLLTAMSLEQWSPDQLEPPTISVDVRQLAEAMGYKKKKSRVFDPRTLQKVAQGIVDLERMYLTIPLGGAEFPVNPKTGRRKKTYLEAERSDRVLAVMSREEVKDLLGTRYPLRWKVKLGSWVTAYPRQFAPILGNLVELSVKGADLWAKNIGVELVFHYRERRFSGDLIVLRVRTLMERAGLLSELEDMRKSGNARRAREYFEKALDTLAEREVLKHWNYHSHDEETLGNFKLGQNTGLENWLGMRVVIAPPELPSLPTAT